MESPEEEMLEAIEELNGEEVIEEKPATAKLDPVEKFLGKGKMIEMPVIIPGYYGELLAWTLQKYIKDEGWKVVKVVSNSPNQPPRYMKANISPGKHMKAMSKGCLLLCRGDSRLAVRIEISWRRCWKRWMACRNA